MLNRSLGGATAILVGCAVFLLPPAGQAHARDGVREDARTKASGQKVRAPKRRAVMADKSASAQVEPFCVRPFEYPRGRR